MFYDNDRCNRTNSYSISFHFTLKAWQAKLPTNVKQINGEVRGQNILYANTNRFTSCQKLKTRWEQFWLYGKGTVSNPSNFFPNIKCYSICVIINTSNEKVLWSVPSLQLGHWVSTLRFCFLQELQTENNWNWSETMLSCIPIFKGF